MHLSDSENIHFLLSSCLLSSRRFQISKVQTKAETIERNVKQRSSSKRLFLELPLCTAGLENGYNHVTSSSLISHLRRLKSKKKIQNLEAKISVLL